MAITIDGGTNTISGLAVGGLPDGVVDGDMLASGTGGKVLQCLQTVLYSTVTTSSTSMVDLTGLSQAITPSATTSKILVSVSLTFAGTGGSGTAFQFVRDSTAIGIGDAAGSRIRSTFGTRDTLGNDAQQNVHVQFLDPNTPADTTTAITYKIQWRARASTSYTGSSVSDTDNSQYHRSISEITVMEIGA
jgi:hypothetical protein